MSSVRIIPIYIEVLDNIISNQLTSIVRIIYKNLHFPPDFPYTLQHLAVDTLFASIGQELRKLLFVLREAK